MGGCHPFSKLNRNGEVEPWVKLNLDGLSVQNNKKDKTAKEIEVKFICDIIELAHQCGIQDILEQPLPLKYMAQLKLDMVDRDHMIPGFVNIQQNFVCLLYEGIDDFISRIRSCFSKKGCECKLLESITNYFNFKHSDFC